MSILHSILNDWRFSKASTVYLWSCTLETPWGNIEFSWVPYEGREEPQEMPTAREIGFLDASELDIRIPELELS